MHPEDCQCDDCLDTIAAGFIQLGSLRWSPQMNVPEEDDEYWDIFKEELDEKYGDESA